MSDPDYFVQSDGKGRLGSVWPPRPEGEDIPFADGDEIVNYINLIIYLHLHATGSPDLRSFSIYDRLFGYSVGIYWTVLVFKVHNALNYVLQQTSPSLKRFNGGGTFFFGALYLRIRLNQRINEQNLHLVRHGNDNVCQTFRCVNHFTPGIIGIYANFGPSFSEGYDQGGRRKSWGLYDNSPVALLNNPPLTSVDTATNSLGRAAVKELVRLLGDLRSQPQHVITPITGLIIRNSTARHY